MTEQLDKMSREACATALNNCQVVVLDSPEPRFPGLSVSGEPNENLRRGSRHQ